jgi:hypothetical protein
MMTLPSLSDAFSSLVERMIKKKYLKTVPLQLSKRQLS